MARSRAPRRGAGSHTERPAAGATAANQSENPQQATAAPEDASRAEHPTTRGPTAALAPDAVSAALRLCMPDAWTRDDDAQGLIHRLSNDEAAIVLAWLATQWRDGYRAAVVDLRAGRRPLTETEQ